MATVKDIARQAGVGVATVSRALNRTGYIKPSTLVKIEQVAQELGYIPNRQARAMVNGKTMTLGILIPDMDNALFMRIVRGINDTAYPLGYSLLVMDSRGDSIRERQILRTMQELRVDGLILFCTPGTAELLSIIDDTFPIVVIDRLLEGVDVPQVSVNHYHGAQLATDLLLSQCHYPPAFLGGPDTVTSSILRLQGYLVQLAAAGIGQNEARVEMGQFTYEGGYRGMRQLLGRYTSIDGVFAANDLSALGALRALRDEGLRCPDDIRIVGFDDIEATRYVYPSLTTIRQPMNKIGQTALELLLSQKYKGAPLTGPILLPGKLVRRESC